MADYEKRHYKVSVKESNDELVVEKCAHSDWFRITMIKNGIEGRPITIRSQVMAEQLHFMLGQMLNGCNNTEESND